MFKFSIIFIYIFLSYFIIFYQLAQDWSVLITQNLAKKNDTRKLMTKIWN